MKPSTYVRLKSFALLLLLIIAPAMARAAGTQSNVDLQISKFASSTNLAVGSNVVFFLTLQNLGPGSVTNAITVTDCLPAGITYVSDSTMSNSINGTYSPGTCWWTLPSGLASGGSVSITITGQASMTGIWTNTASVGVPPGYTDPNLSNNTSSVTLTVTSSPPIMINCSSNITVPATSSSGALVFFNVTATGGCSSLTITSSPPSGSTFPIGTTTVMSTASDTCGHSTNCSFTVTVTRPPISINCSSNITVAATSGSGAIVFYNVTASGGCSSVNVTSSPPSGSTFPVGTTTVMSSASDNCGTFTNCSFTVTVTNPPISINCSSNITVTATGSNGAVVFFTVTASGGCSTPSVNSFPPSGSTFGFGTTTVMSSASDTCGTTTNCSFTVTVTRPPVTINCSSNITVAASSSNGAVVFFTVTGSGGCSPPPNVVAVPASGSTFPIGTTTVTSTASDNCGTTTNCSFTVTVTRPPITINCSTNISVTTTNNAGAVVFFTVTASGGCSPPNVVCNPPSGSTFPIGTTTVLSTATDNCATTTNCSFTVTVALTNNTTTADLQVTKTASTNTVRVGQQAVFTVLLQNLGPNAITNDIVVTDCLPAGFEYVTDSTYGNSSNGVYSPGTCWWTYPGLAANASATLTITVQAIATNVWTNTATVGVPAGITDPNTNNNTSSAVVTVTQPQADLQVTKTASTNLLKLGDQVIFTVLLTNLGPDFVTNEIIVTDCLPSGFTYVTDNTYGNTNNGSYSPGTCWWTWSSGLGTNTVAQLQITATATATNVYTNTATVGVPVGITDTNLSNNVSSVVVTNRSTTADLQIQKSISSTNVQVGQQVTYTLTLNNLGPDNVTNPVVVTDCLASGLQYVSDSGGGAYSAGTCLWTLANGVAVGSPQTLMITVQASTNTCITNTATVAVPTNVIDPNMGNNTATVQSCINPRWTITGTVKNCSSNSAGLGMVTITLSGATNLTTTTDTNGNYSFTNLLSGNYTVTPTQNGNNFTPASANVMLTSSGATVPAFVGNVPLISGQITYSTNGTAVPGVLVQLTGPVNTTALTSSNGSFVFTNTPAGTYTVTPVPTNGYVFGPTNRTVTLTALNCATNVSFVASNRTVQLVAMEVTQVIQDWSNSVPLVANKRTFLRAHMQLPSTNVPPVLVQGARVFGFVGGFPIGIISPVNTNGVLLVNTTNAPYARSNWSSSLNFELPAAWTTAGTISLVFSWSSNATLVINCPPPAGSTNGIVSCTFSNMPAIPVRYYGFNFTNAANAGAVQNVNNMVFTNLGTLLTAMYPVPDVSRDIAQYIGPSMLSVPQVIPPRATNNGIDEFGFWTILIANTRLQTTRTLDRLQGSFGSGLSNVVYYGAIAGQSPDTLGVANLVLIETNTQIANRQQLIASGFIGTSIYGANYRQSHSHEIGHTLGRPHDVMANGRGVCTERGPMVLYPLFQTAPGVYVNKPALGRMDLGTNALVYGLDTAALAANYDNPVISPFAYFDIMSYCSKNPFNNMGNPLDEWISTYTYAALMTNIATNFGTVTPPIATPLKTFKLVRGVINETVTNAYMQAVLTFTTTNKPPPVSPGRYFLNLYDSLTNLIGSVPFNPDQFENEDETEMEEETLDTFVIPVEVDNTNVAMIQIVDSNTSTVVASMSGSSNAPTVFSGTTTTDGGGPFTGSGDIIFNWNGSDANPGAVLTYTVQISLDGGATWQTLDPDYSGSSYTNDSSTLPPTTQGLIQVIANDGFNSSSPAYSSLFTIPAHPPTVAIYNPANGAIYSGDQQIYFDVSAVDQTDGVLDGNSVQWVSSLNGVLGYGARLNLEADTLTEGAHTITAYGFASSGLIGSASVQIFVLQQPQPQLSLNYLPPPINVIQLTWPASYTNYVLQTTTSLAPSQWNHVTNTPMVNGAFQTVTIPAPAGNTAYFRLTLP